MKVAETLTNKEKEYHMKYVDSWEFPTPLEEIIFNPMKDEFLPSNEARTLPFKYDYNEYLAKRFPVTSIQISSPISGHLQMTKFDLGDDVYLAAHGKHPSSPYKTGNPRWFFLSLFWKGKKCKVNPWPRLRDFLNYMSEWPENLRYPPPEFVYFRPSPITGDKGLEHLKLLEYHESNITEEMLKEKYSNELGAYPSRAYDDLGNQLWVVGQDSYNPVHPRKWTEFDHLSELFANKSEAA